MGASKEYFLRMRSEDFENLSNEARALFTYVELRESDEYEMHKEDKYYISLKKAERKAKKDVQTYLFNKRHNHKS
jgi:hypothetical protein